MHSFIHSFMTLFSQRCGEPVVFQTLFRVQGRGGTEHPHLGYWSLPFGTTDEVSIRSATLYLKESFTDRAIPCPAEGVIFGPGRESDPVPPRRALSCPACPLWHSRPGWDTRKGSCLEADRTRPRHQHLYHRQVSLGASLSSPV